MAAKFHERFDIEVGIEEAKQRFVNRIRTAVFSSKYNHESYAAWAPMMDKTCSVYWL
jgi:hypothetical protein